MIKRSIVVRLRDILGVADEAIEIVSEASRHIPEDLKSQYPGMNWNEIKSIGNLLRHEYQRIC